MEEASGPPESGPHERSRPRRGHPYHPAPDRPFPQGRRPVHSIPGSLVADHLRHPPRAFHRAKRHGKQHHEDRPGQGRESLRRPYRPALYSRGEEPAEQVEQGGVVETRRAASHPPRWALLPRQGLCCFKRAATNG